MLGQEKNTSVAQSSGVPWGLFISSSLANKMESGMEGRASLLGAVWYLGSFNQEHCDPYDGQSHALYTLSYMILLVSPRGIGRRV